MENRRAIVAVCTANDARYPPNPPFNPPEYYPEYPFSTLLDKSNSVYPSVRDLLKKLTLDEQNFGTKKWNPFGCFINPGDTVIIKPNFVVDSQLLSEIEFQSAVTHGSVIRPIIDYTYIALNGNGKIIIADGPIDLTDFKDTIQKNGMLETVNFLKNEHSVQVEILDLRYERLKKLSSFTLGRFECSIWYNEKLPGDPLGYVTIDLKRESEFEEIAEKCNNIRSIQPIHNKSEPTFHHNKGKHEYSMAKTILNADVIINVPKLKTHKKTGNTINLKNTIGVIVPRHWMPHFMKHFDEFDESVGILPKTIKIFLSLFHINGVGCILVRNRQNIPLIESSGSNPKNDTLWRAILDVNKILFYADEYGRMQNTQQRKYFSIVDGIIGGEKNSPLSPSPIETKLIIGGIDPIAVDYIATEIMGFDYRKIKPILKSFDLKQYSFGVTNPDDISIIGEMPTIQFTPPKHWIDYIEKKTGKSLKKSQYSQSK